MMIRYDKASFVLCVAILVGVHCTNLANTAENENEASADNTCVDYCANNGVCDGEGDVKSCSCKPGTSGALCEKVDACENMICNYYDDVKCVYDGSTGGGKCVCENSTKSFDYDTQQCRTPCSTKDDCGSFEKCEESFSGGYFCECLPGRSGENCEIIYDCFYGKYRTCRRDNGRCIYSLENERAECDCGDGKMWDDRWDQKRCRKICKDDCAHNGICEGNGDEKYCSCLPATEGDMCEKVKDCSREKNLCGFGSDVKCTSDGYNSKCVCDNSSKLFDSEEKLCRVPCEDDCHNNGKCEYAPVDRDCCREFTYFPKFCFCKQGTSGDLCETVDACTENDFCGVKTDVKCVYDKTKDKAQCKCDDPKKSFDSNTKMCKPFCKTDIDCLSTERCVENEDGQGLCTCKAGRSGSECQFVNDCTFGRFRFCNGGYGRCSYNDVKEASECDCGVGKMWDDSEYECRYICNDNCLNNGTCEGVDDAKFCRCNAGIMGDFCEYVHDCDWAEICGNSTDVKCVYDESIGAGNCLCDNDTKVFDYHKKECQDMVDQ